MGESTKRYFWLRLKKTYFNQLEQKKMSRQANGKDMQIVYLRMMLLSLDNDGYIFFQGVYDSLEEELAEEFNESVEIIRKTVTYLVNNNMVTIDAEDNCFLPEAQSLTGSECYSAERMRRLRKKLKASHCDSDVTPCDEEKEIEKDKENSNINTNCASDNAPKASRSEINEFFERIWKLYPNKKGKGQVSDAKKKKLYDIGYDEISRAIDRYKDGLLKDDWRKPQNGSTFFNSGYVDYLDANYSKPQDRQEMDAEQQRAQWQRNYEENQQYLRKMLGTPRPTQPDDPFQ
ncbi:phage replisome organizer N-terminal domain-containing protein [Roseburia sp. BX1005]|uniref:Phage replisome organizer N-terminal domain-containing protein n=1 Tax=Roseburia zhanii TaxID=2763064 RepID=A0A923LM23_9FIRM|nr:phage replisome organizer N-terminal domain-containing protein [Roseburia zhanii]MBC5712752.1 phage replisome organizer N-terminal domain-containing protein [Roseburia zhanii]